MGRVKVLDIYKRHPGLCGEAVQEPAQRFQTTGRGTDSYDREDPGFVFRYGWFVQ